MTTQPEEAGSRFWKTDLHIHTPISECFSDSFITPEQLVEAVLAAGLEVIGITDHNTVQGVPEMSEIAAERGLVLFPGVELTTKQGHVLAIFERNTDLEMLRQFLRQVGIGEESEGAGTVATRDSMVDILRRIDDLGGIAIAAHIDRWPTGFIETNEHRSVKTEIHNSDYLSALEITQWNNKSQWTEGRMRGYPKEYPCIQGSDTHALEDVGRRWTYMRLNRLDVDGLRQALHRHYECIRFPHEMGEGIDPDS